MTPGWAPSRGLTDPPVILVVEGHPNGLELSLEALRRIAVRSRIEVARDGAEALALLFGEGPDAAGTLRAVPRVILLDLRLPKIDGLDVLRRLKADPRTRAIPVVALTASREAGDLAEAYRLGVNSYIVKPVDFDQFVDAMRQIGLYWLVLNEPLRP